MRFDEDYDRLRSTSSGLRPPSPQGEGKIFFNAQRNQTDGLAPKEIAEKIVAEF